MAGENSGTSWKMARVVNNEVKDKCRLRADNRDGLRVEVQRNSSLVQGNKKTDSGRVTGDDLQVGSQGTCCTGSRVGQTT